jgi:hypothetical protein
LPVDRAAHPTKVERTALPLWVSFGGARLLSFLHSLTALSGLQPAKSLPANPASPASSYKSYNSFMRCARTLLYTGGVSLRAQSNAVSFLSQNPKD